MPAAEKDIRIAELKQKLVELDVRFNSAAQQRGFDPAQIENLALPAALANIVSERLELTSELEELDETQEGEV